MYMTVGDNMKLNKKGFVVSSVLYTLLIVFMMVLLLSLSSFSSTSALISVANESVIENNVIYMNILNTDSDEEIIKISSKFGTKYWPKDFSGDDYSESKDGNIKLSYYNDKSEEVDQNDIKVKLKTGTSNYYIDAISVDENATVRLFLNKLIESYAY